MIDQSRVQVDARTLPTLTPAYSPTPTISPTATPTPTPVVYPHALSIPILGIDRAPLEYIGVDGSGTMEAPRDPKTVGWLNIGPKPGEIGNAIFAGHYDDQSGHPAIFAHLQRIPIGSEIMVHMVDGTQRSFFVDFVGETNTAENNIQAITRQTSYPSITLVTCHGSWDARNGIYSKRLIVYGK